VQQPARERVVDCRVVTKSGEHVVHEPAVVVDVPRLVTYHPWYLVPLRELDQRRSQRRFMPARVMKLYFDREPFAEDIAPLAEGALRSPEITRAQTGCDWPRCRTGQHLESLAPLRYLKPRNARTTA